MIVQDENVYSTALLSVQLEHELPLLSVGIDEDDHLISEIAQQIFTTHYDKLFEIKNARSIKLSDLIKQKNSLEKTCIPYPTQGRYLGICAIQYVASNCLGVGFILTGSATNGVGIIGTAGAVACLEALLTLLPCVSNVLKNHDTVLSNISVISKQQQEIIQLIKFTNVFAKFCREWPQLIQNFEKIDQLKSFKLFKDILNEIDENIVKIAGEEFLHLAPLFLMEKVCSLSSTGELANSWNHIKALPEFWENNDLWKKVQLKNPSVNDYIIFFKSLYTHSLAEPSKWSEWFSKKLDMYIENIETPESI